MDLTKVPLTWWIVLCCSGNWVVRKRYWLLYSYLLQNIGLFHGNGQNLLRLPVPRMSWSLSKKEISILLDSSDCSKNILIAVCWFPLPNICKKENYFSCTCKFRGLGGCQHCRFSLKWGKTCCLGQYSCQQWDSKSYNWLFDVWEG